LAWGACRTLALLCYPPRGRAGLRRRRRLLHRAPSSRAEVKECYSTSRRFVGGTAHVEGAVFPFESAALRAEPADANVGRRTDTLMCAHAAGACGLSATARPARHRRGAAQRRPYSPAPSRRVRRPPGVVKRYALAASSCLVVVQVPIKGASKRNKERTRNASNVGLVMNATSRRPRDVATKYALVA